MKPKWEMDITQYTFGANEESFHNRSASVGAFGVQAVKVIENGAAYLGVLAGVVGPITVGIVDFAHNPDPVSGFANLVTSIAAANLVTTITITALQSSNFERET